MKEFSALLRLQFLSRLADLKPRNLKRALQEKKGKTVGMAAAYAFLLIYVIAFLVAMEYLMMDALTKVGMGDLLMGLAVTLSMMSTMIFAFFFIMSTLYFGRDAAFLASLPVSSRTVLSAKLTQVWMGEAGISVLLILPVGVLYSLKTGTDVLFFLRLLPVALFAPVLPIVIVAFLSTLLIRLTALWKRREMMATVSVFVFLIGYLVFMMQFTSSMPENPEEILVEFFRSNQARIRMLTGIFPPAGWAANGLMGDWGQLILFILVCAGAAAACVWLLGDVYRRLSLLPVSQTAKKKKIRETDMAAGSAFKALFLRELRQLLRVPAYAQNSLPTVIMPALMTGVMAFSLSGTLEGTEVQAVLAQLPRGMVMGGMAAAMAFMAGINPAVCTAVTREGKGHAMMISLPVSPRITALAKLALGYGMAVIGCVPAAVVLMILVPGFEWEALGALLICLLYCYVCCTLALANDIAHPKFNWLTEIEAIKQKSGALVGMLISWGLLIALGGLGFLLLRAGVSALAFGGILAALLAIGAYLSHQLLMKTADEKYCLN